jgi:hypothetical protein
MKPNEKPEFKYVIDISYLNGETEEFKITTNDIDFVMDQYQRNRDPFTYDVASKEAI